MTSSIKKLLLLLLLLNLSSWMILLATLSTTAAAFVGIPSSASSLPQRFVSTTATQPTHSRLAVISHPAGSTPSSSSSENMSSSSKDGLSLGKKLEGGQVIDFSSVKASSTAEKALSEARKLFLEHGSGGANSFTTTTTVSHDGTAVLLGINQDVVDQVGHSLGTFATPAEIQACARYLRSRAPAHLFSSSLSSHSSELAIVVDDKNSFGPHDIAKFQKILHNAYYESGEVTAAFAKTFYMGTMLLGENARKAIWAIYVWCRRTDEIVDAPRDNDADMLRDLSSWEIRLEDLWEKGQVVDVYDLCLLDVRINYPCLNIQPFLDMIRGMLMDVPGLGQERYETFDELHLYCYRVAGTVGVMSLPIFGCAPGFNDDRAREPALSLGVAFQLTNILRDVGEDAVQRGRVYLPQEDLRRFGVTEEQIRAQRVDDKYRALMKFEIERARMYYQRARRGVFMLAPESRLPVQSSLDAYGRILDKIEENDYDSLTKRAYVDKWEKLSILPFSWYRTTEMSQIFPLPGEQPVDLTVS